MSEERLVAALVVSGSDLPLKGGNLPLRGVGYPHRSLQRRTDGAVSRFGPVTRQHCTGDHFGVRAGQNEQALVCLANK